MFILFLILLFTLKSSFPLLLVQILKVTIVKIKEAKLKRKLKILKTIVNLFQHIYFGNFE